MALLAGFYEKVPLIFLEKAIIWRMERPCSQKLYETILNLVSTESEKYPKRDYGTEMNERIGKERARTQENCTAGDSRENIQGFVKKV